MNERSSICLCHGFTATRSRPRAQTPANLLPEGIAALAADGAAGAAAAPRKREPTEGAFGGSEVPRHRAGASREEPGPHLGKRHERQADRLHGAVHVGDRPVELGIIDPRAAQVIEIGEPTDLRVEPEPPREGFDRDAVEAPTFCTRR